MGFAYADMKMFLLTFLQHGQTHFRRILVNGHLPWGFEAEALNVKPEWSHGSHKFDFLLEIKEKRVVVEVKSVNLVVDRVAMFPDAPTSRGSKHLQVLCELLSCGYECRVIFLVMRSDADLFRFNYLKDPLFHTSALKAKNLGVRFSCLSLSVDLEEVRYNKELRIDWEE